MIVVVGIVLAMVAVVVVYLVGTYNNLVAVRESVKQAWANIDVLLKQRHDELPTLYRDLQAIHAIRATDAGHGHVRGELWG